MRIVKLGLLLLTCTTLTACSDPATQEPVSLKPGLYRLTMDGTQFGPFKASDGKKVEEQCVAGESDLEWIYPMIQRKFCPECACSTKDKTRTGNAIGADAICPHDDDSDTFGAFEYAYRGVVSEEGVTLEGKVRSGLATALPPDPTEEQKKDAARVAEMWDSMVLSGRIERVGDCPA